MKRYYVICIESDKKGLFKDIGFDIEKALDIPSRHTNKHLYWFGTANQAKGTIDAFENKPSGNEIGRKVSASDELGLNKKPMQDSDRELARLTSHQSKAEEDV